MVQLPVDIDCYTLLPAVSVTAINLQLIGVVKQNRFDKDSYSNVSFSHLNKSYVE